MKRFARIAIAASALTSLAPAAEAKLYISYNNVGAISLPANAATIVALQPGVNSATVTVPTVTSVLVSYSAICDNLGSSGTAVTNIAIYLDGTILPVFNSVNDTWCRGPDWPIRTSHTVAVRLSTGSHEFVVKGITNSTGAGTLSNTSFVVFD